jgi:hypothetical protein
MGDGRVSMGDAPLGVMPVWVTLGEASFLAGVSEERLHALIRAGTIEVSEIRQGRRGPRLVMVRTRDLGLARTSDPSAHPRGTTRHAAAEAPGEGLVPSGPAPNSPTAAGRRARIWTRLTGGRRSLARVSLGWSVGGAALVILALVGASVSRPGTEARPGAVAAPGPPGSVAWAVRTPTRTYIALIVVPAGKPPAAIAIPGETSVDLPGSGLFTVEEGAVTGGMLLASVQSTVGRTVDHFLVGDSAALRRLVDALGGIDVQLIGTVTWEGLTYGPGDVHLEGGAVLTYLHEALPEDATYRWMAVLGGLLHDDGDADSDSSAWELPLGQSDSPSEAQAVLRTARDAAVLDLPTLDAEGGPRPDSRAVDEMVLEHLGGFGDELVRVTVLNGNGRPGIGRAVNEIIAPAGFRVVTAQNIEPFDVERTRILASTDELLPRAEEAADLLGAGEVFAGPQPTGISDLTIVVGKDFPLPPGVQASPMEPATPGS